MTSSEITNYPIIKLRILSCQNWQLFDRALYFERARPSFQVIFKFFPEFFHKRDGRHRGRVAQWAERPAQHVFRQVLDVIDILLHAAACMEACQCFLEPVGAFTAGDTTAAAFES